MKEQNPNFFYDICVYSDNSLKHVFWVDARSRAAYEYFGDMVSFNTTYKLNKFEMPVTAFVGVDHHRRSCLFGCALLGNEETESFEWLMQTFVKCMEKIPYGILTDQCGAMAIAIQNVLPNTRHRLWIWHITKKILHKLGRLSRYEEIKATMNGIIYESHSRELFERSLYDFIEEYTLHDNNWLNDIYHIRNIWVPVFLEHEFWASMRSTQRIESMHAFFDKYLTCRSSLIQFVHQYDNCLVDKQQQELECDAADNRGLIPCVSNSPIENQFQYEYTNFIFHYVQAKFIKKCDCNLSPKAVKDNQYFYEMT
ncbi:protein FAR1-RELATED SEQUENCE 5-like [Arachis duranensis]|uniref:Protein FAR1-RELATED SEQUENCE n=1 Tax=Arachis duranensis TaxID=130453 RepID=A0A6P4BMH8_ARADU|nr:protein FAR1-RELATED SEQUENCE 5-like [Arachis duranensis]